MEISNAIELEEGQVLEDQISGQFETASNDDYPNTDEKINAEKERLLNEISLKAKQIEELHNEISTIRNQIIEVPSKNAINFMIKLFDVNQFKHRQGIICQILKILVEQKIPDTKITLLDNKLIVEWKTNSKYRRFTYTIANSSLCNTKSIDLPYGSIQYEYSNRFFGYSNPQYGLFKQLNYGNLYISNVGVGISCEFRFSSCGHDYFLSIILTNYQEI
jgi:hypothetical protein